MDLIKHWLKTIQLIVRPNTFTETKAIVVKEWYRKERKSQLTELVAKWGKIIRVNCNDWGVKQIRTNRNLTMPLRKKMT